MIIRVITLEPIPVRLEDNNMKLFLTVFILTVLFTIQNLFCFTEAYVENNLFSQTGNHSNIEYNGEVIRLSFSNARSVTGSKTAGAVIDPDTYPYCSVRIAPESVIKENGKYKMWVCAADSLSWRIGYLDSSDPNGINWTKYSNSSLASLGGSVLGKENVPSFGSLHVMTPSVIKDGNQFKMWFAGIGLSGYKIGYASATNEMNWIKYSNTSPVSLLGALLGSENTPSFASNGTHDPVVIKDNNIYKMWYFGDSSSGSRIGYAFSADGTNWNKYTNSAPGLKGAILGKENSHVSFASGNICDPSVVKDGQKYRMWFVGGDGILPRIGYAVSTNGIDWSVTSNTYTPVAMKGALLGSENLPSFCSTSTRDPVVVMENNSYKIWFSGKDAGGIDRIGLAQMQYHTTGTFQSPLIDAGTPRPWNKIYFTENPLTGCSTKFQIRCGNTPLELNSNLFIGPDGTSSSFYDQNGEQITHVISRFIQYKAFLSTVTVTQSPELISVRFGFKIYDSLDSLLAGPNPFSLSQDRILKLVHLPDNSIAEIYTLSGRHMMTLKNPAGGVIEWNGCNEQGLKLLPGVYVCRISVPGEKNSLSLRIVIVK